ncbi:MAG: amidophosphoribosyltransferase [Candidatus Cloacimonetes bacterium]|nr:amidophosphoribosyltransferase [Candidatus Cloacimonadota bacterium]
MCGIIGIYQKDKKHTNAAKLAAYALFAEQHRGQESSGIAVSDGNKISLVKEMGLVKEVFTEKKLKKMDGKLAIGHVRYPTKGKSNINNAQPYLLNTLSGQSFALVGNGDIVNYSNIRKQLEKQGVFFESENDGELILKYLVFCHIKKGMSIIESIKKIMQNFQGSYSTLLLIKNKIYAFRDPYGNRPFIIGEKDNTYVFASETCCLNIINVDFIREVSPAEILIVDEKGLKSTPQNPNNYRTSNHNAHCVFEMIYFSRPDSIVYNHKVYDFREKLGQKLAENENNIPDVVIPIPDSSNFIALGYAKGLGVDFNFGLIRNHYVGRTFIVPEQTIRDEGVTQKFNVLPDYFKGKIVTLVDDSIVRGTTIRKLVKMVRKNGAKQVHIRIGSPMVKFSCFYGIDTPTHEELIANQKTVEEIKDYLGADSLRYLTIGDLKNLVKNNKEFCYACFDGKYPIKTLPRRHKDTKGN